LLWYTNSIPQQRSFVKWASKQGGKRGGRRKKETEKVGLKCKRI